jgi:outer membrane protein OmpA-like peptidoglycan-associated protein
MKSNTTINMTAKGKNSLLKLRMKIALGILATTLFVPMTEAQEPEFTRPSIWIGAAVGANFNFYGGSTQRLNSEFIAPAVFHKGSGVGLYLAPLLEYHKPGSVLGVMFQAGYDSRNGAFNEITTPCNCPANLTTKITYVTLEPSLRFSPLANNFYLYAGPRIAFNKKKSFVYSQGTNPDYPDQVANPDVKGDLSNMNKTLVSVQVGAGYDIQLSSQQHSAQWVLSPYVAFQPYQGQSPRSIETWTVTTLRAGMALKLGFGSKIDKEVKVKDPKDPNINFMVHAPKNVPTERRIREIFPIRNYVFFDVGSTEISDRYVLLNKNQVAEFKEDQLETFKPKKLSGRSERQMIVYYNILNILGDRMGKDPASRITLVGSSWEGPEDGLAMAASTKKYLVDIFGIDTSRVKIQGRTKPKLPSEKPGGTLELELLREGDRRVSIESNSPSLLMEFQSGPDAPLKPVEIHAVMQAPVESYVTFHAEGAREGFNSWSMEIKDDKGAIQNYGPYTQEKVSIPGKTIMGTRPEGDYKVTMLGNAKNGNLVKREQNVHMVLWKPPTDEEGTRYSVLFEFDESKSNAIYTKYLREIVAKQIPLGGTVVVHGHTDIIGEPDYNEKLSVARAEDVRTILQNALAESGRTDVTFQVYGFGEDEDVSPFENKFPEERFHNRTVLIDIYPGSKK